MSTYQESFDKLGAALEDLKDSILVAVVEAYITIQFFVLNSRRKK